MNVHLRQCSALTGWLFLPTEHKDYLLVGSSLALLRDDNVAVQRMMAIGPHNDVRAAAATSAAMPTTPGGPASGLARFARMPTASSTELMKSRPEVAS